MSYGHAVSVAVAAVPLARFHCRRCYLEAAGLTLALIHGGLPTLMLARVQSGLRKATQTAGKTVGRWPTTTDANDIPRTTEDDRGQQRPLDTAGKPASMSTSTVEPDFDDLITANEASRLTGYAAETIRRWVREEKLQRRGTSTRLKVSRTELRDFLNRGGR